MQICKGSMFPVYSWNSHVSSTNMWVALLSLLVIEAVWTVGKLVTRPSLGNGWCVRTLFSPPNEDLEERHVGFALRWWFSWCELMILVVGVMEYCWICLNNMFNHQILKENSTQVWGKTQLPTTITYNLLRLMVQKSQGQPPGMY